MADITQLILSKYYGFGADAESKKFLASHDGTYDPGNYRRRSYSNGPQEAESIEVASGRGTSSETAKDEMENSSPAESAVTAVTRSSRAILDDDALDNEESETNDYANLVKSPTGRAAGASGEDNRIANWTDLLAVKLEKNDGHEEITRDDSVLGYFEDNNPDDVSDVSSIVQTRKKIKKKKSFFTAASPASPAPHQLTQPPRKLPACNGVFLDLNNNSLVEFPTGILSNIPNLRMLYLENNSLTELPEELFTSLKLLQWLDVRNNRLSSLPRSIRHHSCLETILLQGNLFEKLPLELCLIPSLKGLLTTRNPLEFPPADVLALGFAATMNYLRSEWNKLNPDEAVASPERNKKPKPAAILCCDPPTVRSIGKSSRLIGSSSTAHVSQAARKISAREKSWNYRPSNRCENRGTDEELEMRLLWIAKAKEMLTKQAVALQKIKDREALSDWRRDRRSYEKSMSRAANRNEEDIPFAVDLEDLGMLFKNIPRAAVARAKSKKRGSAPPRNINEKMRELYESLGRLQEARKSATLTPRAEQKFLENEIKKLTEMQDEIQNLRRHNENTTVPFEESEPPQKTQPYKPPPSIII